MSNLKGPGPGRPKGSQSKIRQEIRDMLDQLGCNPIRAMAMIAMDQANEMTIRVTCLKEVAKYYAPQLKAVEVKQEESPKIQVAWDDEEEDDDIPPTNNEESPE